MSFKRSLSPSSRSMTSAAFDLISLIRPATRPWARRYKCQIQKTNAEDHQPDRHPDDDHRQPLGRGLFQRHGLGGDDARSVSAGWEGQSFDVAADAFGVAFAVFNVDDPAAFDAGTWTAT